MATESVQAGAERVLAERDDLTFTERDEAGRLRNWCPPGRTEDWYDGREAGKLLFAQVVALANEEEYQAFLAITSALGEASLWRPGGSEEAGFVEALACYAMVGMRALSHDTENPYDPKWSATCAAEQRRDILAAQLKSLGVTPWRTIHEAGFDKVQS